MRLKELERLRETLRVAVNNLVVSLVEINDKENLARLAYDGVVNYGKGDIPFTDEWLRDYAKETAKAAYDLHFGGQNV